VWSGGFTNSIELPMKLCSRGGNPGLNSIRSAKVDFPWSICAMMQKLRMRACAVDAGSIRRSTGTVGIPWFEEVVYRPTFYARLMGSLAQPIDAS